MQLCEGSEGPLLVDGRQPGAGEERFPLNINSVLRCLALVSFLLFISEVRVRTFDLPLSLPCMKSVSCFTETAARHFIRRYARERESILQTASRSPRLN